MNTPTADDARKKSDLYQGDKSKFAANFDDIVAQAIDKACENGMRKCRLILDRAYKSQLPMLLEKGYTYKTFHETGKFFYLEISWL